MAQEQKSSSASAPREGADSKLRPAMGDAPLPEPPSGAPLAGAPAPGDNMAKAEQEPAEATDLALILPPSTVVSLGSSSPPHKLPPPLPNMAARSQGASPPTLQPMGDTHEGEAVEAEPAVRRMARRRPAGPPRTKIAANDDAPSIGGLIYALEQKPSTTPFKYAAMATAGWTAICLVFVWIMVRAELAAGATFLSLFEKPATFLTVTAIIVPVAVLWALALLAWRSDELRLRSSTMTEVAIRLAEPDRMAEQSVASLGQAVRRQVSFMNDAISRALGRAGELEALVHNEVSALERSYEENERKIKGLIQELAGERTSLLSTSERVTETLKALGSDIPSLIDKLSDQQIKLAGIIQGAGENLTQLESAVGQSTDRLENALGQSTGRLESALGSKTQELQVMLEGYTSGLATALGARTDQLQSAIASYVDTLDTSLNKRTEKLQRVFEEYARALDTTLTNRAQSLDTQLIERTKALDAAFGERLRSFDESIVRSTMTIDSAVAEKARALTSALDNHAKTFSETISRQAVHLDESLMHGINSVRRTSENITRQSLKAIEGLAGQSEMLKRVSENLLGQVNAVTNRFEGQGQAILRAANSLETANYKIDATLQGRHAALTQTMEQLSGKADEFGRFVQGFSSSMEGSLTSAEQRARQAAEQLRESTEAAQRAALADLERFRLEAGAEGERALDELKNRFSSISTVVNEQLSSLSSRFDQTSDEVRQRANRAAADIAAEQARLKQEMERLPTATRESAEAMRRALHDQLRAIEQLSQLTTRSIAGRDVSLPQPSTAYPATTSGSLTGSYVAGARAGATRQPSSSYAAALPRPPASTASPSPAQAGDGREGWSLGDLLARASREEEAHPGAGHRVSAPQNGDVYNPGVHDAGVSRNNGGDHHPRVDGPPSGADAYQTPAATAPVPFHNQIDAIARSLDPATTAALWQRIAAGQRGVMVRSLYTPEGRTIFDDLSLRYRTDAELQRIVNHYLIDFENIRHDAEQRDPSGRAVNAHLLSDMGRVYLFLAHVSGRIA